MNSTDNMNHYLPIPCVDPRQELNYTSGEHRNPHTENKRLRMVRESAQEDMSAGKMSTQDEARDLKMDV